MNPGRLRQHGFTLLEVLIALTVFAILATITSTALHHAFTTRSHINEQANTLNEMQMALTLLARDSQQVLARSIHAANMQEFPAFIGQKTYYEFTRDGIINPLAMEQRSSLKRVAILCQGDKLIRRSWLALDPMSRKQFEDKVLMTRLSACQFNYLNRNLQLLPEWRGSIGGSSRIAKEPLPKAIQVNLTLAGWGSFNYLLLIPEAIYAEIPDAKKEEATG